MADEVVFELTQLEFVFMMLGDFFGLVFVFFLIMFAVDHVGVCKRKARRIREKSSSLFIR